METGVYGVYTVPCVTVKGKSWPTAFRGILWNGSSSVTVETTSAWSRS